MTFEALLSHRRILSAAILSAFALAACGGGTSDDTGTISSAASVAASEAASDATGDVGTSDSTDDSISTAERHHRHNWATSNDGASVSTSTTTPTTVATTTPVTTATTTASTTTATTAPTTVAATTSVATTTAPATAASATPPSTTTAATTTQPATSTPATTTTTTTTTPTAPADGHCASVTATTCSLAASMARGINLGNMLEAPVEGDWGPVFDPAWPPLIKAAGFSTVRLPVRFSNHASVDASALLDPTFLARVDYVLAQLKAAGLNVVIDMHHYRQLDGDGLDSGEIAVDPSVVQARAIAIWTQLGSHFASQPASVMFELYNEPHNIQDTGASAPWNALYPKLLAAVRKTNPTRAVLIGPAFWNNASALPDFTPPTDSNVIVTIHNYLPTVFTLQGQWGQPQPINTPWNGDATAFTGALDTAKAWSVAQGKPIFVGEFGSNLAAPLASRVAWTTMARTQIEARGFQWAVWNFDSDFGLYDTSAKAWNTALLKTLFP